MNEKEFSKLREAYADIRVFSVSGSEILFSFYLTGRGKNFYLSNLFTFTKTCAERGQMKVAA